MEKLPLIELAELNKSIIFRDSFQDIFSIADLAEVWISEIPTRLSVLLRCG